MTDGQQDDPIDGEVTPPGKGDKPEKKRGRPATGKGFGRQQTDEEREQEEASTDPIKKAIVLGGLDWRHPGWEPTDKERDMVRMLKFCGNTDEDVARILDMTVETMQKHFDFELKYAKTLLVADLATRAFTRARQGNDVITMFLLKTRGGAPFSERAVQMQALGDALEKAEPDDARRVELVKKLTDALTAANSRKEDDNNKGKKS